MAVEGWGIWRARLHDEREAMGRMHVARKPGIDLDV